MSPAKPTYQPNQIKYLSFSVRTKLGLFAALLFLLPPKEVDMRLIGNKFSLFDNTFSFKSQHLVKVKVRIMFWRSLSIPGRKAPRLQFRWEWVFCNPFTWKMHCDEKPKLALRSETKRKTFRISFVLFLYFFCYLFVFLLIIPSHETCVEMYITKS